MIPQTSVDAGDDPDRLRGHRQLLPGGTGDGQVLNAVLMLTTSILGPVLTERFAPRHVAALVPRKRPTE